MKPRAVQPSAIGEGLDGVRNASFRYAPTDTYALLCKRCIGRDMKVGNVSTVAAHF
jgi:hypothetical protein